MVSIASDGTAVDTGAPAERAEPRRAGEEAVSAATSEGAPAERLDISQIKFAHTWTHLGKCFAGCGGPGGTNQRSFYVR